MQSITADLSKQSWSIQPNFFDQALILELKQQALDYQRAGLFQAAKIGASNDSIRNPSIRSDETYWIEPEASQAESHYWQKMDALRLELNQALFLGLFELEAHFARYGTGSFYKKHLDKFQNRSTRKVSTVLYLNEDWQEADGGQLVLYDMNDQIITEVYPKAGTLVCFLSDTVPHEVKPAHRERLSIAGWFRTR